MLDWVRRTMAAETARRGEHIQSLWGGYGEIVRVRLGGGRASSAIVKRVEPGAGGGRSHERKLRSYAVERRFYADWSVHCDERCRVPHAFAAERSSTGWRFLLEDLDAAGFAGRRRSVTEAELDRCLAWLAHFHATFLGEAPRGLWPIGTYWHLATRPDELAQIDEPLLRSAAARLDARLTECAHQTIVHGDPKPANFCFAPDGAVAAVDFQYAGGGCGMKDVAYLLFSAHGWGERDAPSERPLDAYFGHLRAALAERRAQVDAAAVEREWRPLYPLAEADFRRFLAGWSKDAGTVRAYRRSLTDEVMRQLA